MSGEILLAVDNAGKKFCRSLKKSMQYGVQDLFNELAGIKKQGPELRTDEFYALHEVSFELHKGDCLGIIGPNGSGKSTLLKLINGIYSLDTGRIMVNGKVGALIEVGAGFHPMLTGRENIYLNGAILGMSRKTIEERLEDIIEFSELSEFIDMQVKYYSSGMNIRLGFAIAVQMKPEILIIDEVLSVGDIRFKAKCINAVLEMMRDSATIFVSHNMTDISRICNRIICLNRGREIYSGKGVHAGIEAYYEISSVKGSNRFHGDKASITSVRIEGEQTEDQSVCIDYGSVMKITVQGMVRQVSDDMTVSVNIFDISQQMIEQNSTWFSNFPIYVSDGHFNLRLTIDKLNLNPGKYYVSVVLHEREHREILAKDHCNSSFMVCGNFNGNAAHIGSHKWENRI